MDIMEFEKRFWDKVSILGKDQCWLWCACSTSKGYGEFALKGSKRGCEKVHRMAWRLTFGEIPEGHWVQHKCGIKLCCNPSHLVLNVNGNESEDWEKSFWSKIHIGNPDECWNWTAKARGEFGYGVTRLKWTPENGRGKMTGAHRVAWELANGPIPNGIQVLHHCDNAPCCNPAHLFLGTQADNMRDMDSKGRRVVNIKGNPESLPNHKGEDHGAAKLTNEQVIQIREMYATGKYFQKALGALFGIQQAAVNKIVTRKTWSHL